MRVLLRHASRSSGDTQVRTRTHTRSNMHTSMHIHSLCLPRDRGEGGVAVNEAIELRLRVAEHLRHVADLTWHLLAYLET